MNVSINKTHQDLIVNLGAAELQEKDIKIPSMTITRSAVEPTEQVRSALRKRSEITTLKYEYIILF